MKPSILFLAGPYRSADLDYYRRLCRGCFTVAVDGGYKFFARSGLAPDLLIGDFDSQKRRPKNLPRKTEVLAYPVEKSQSDAELALRYCLKDGSKRIDLVQPVIGEPDHFTANMMLLTLVPKSVEARLVNRRSEIRWLRNQSLAIKGGTGDRLSIVLLSPRGKLTTTGTAYDVTNLALSRGRTEPTRNRVIAAAASVKLQGEAFVFRLFNRR